MTKHRVFLKYLSAQENLFLVDHRLIIYEEYTSKIDELRDHIVDNDVEVWLLP